MTQPLRAPAPVKNSSLDLDKFDLFDTLTRDIAQAKAVLQIIMLGEIDPTTLNTKILADTCWMLSDKLDYIETNAKALMEVQA